MSTKSVKSQMAKVIALGCDITNEQAFTLIEQAVKHLHLPSKSLVVEGLEDVSLKPHRCPGSTEEVLPLEAAPMVSLEFTAGGIKNVIALGGLEGDPTTPPPDFEPIKIETDLRSLVGRRTPIFFSRGGPVVSRSGHGFSSRLPSVQILASQLSSKKGGVT